MLAFSNDYYGFIFRATQSVELFCAYSASTKICIFSPLITPEWSANLNKITTGIIQSYKLLVTCNFCQFSGISDEILTRFIFCKQCCYQKRCPYNGTYKMEDSPNFVCKGVLTERTTAIKPSSYFVNHE